MKVLETDEIIMSHEEYEALIERIEDLKDIIDAYRVRNNPFRPFDEAVKDLGI